MSSNLKKLVGELELILVERGDSLDAPAREAFQVQIDNLKKEVDEAKAAEIGRLTFDVLNVLAALLGVVTNVMTLLK
ncbi:hypothetical protein [Burkholderia sp. AW49-1]